jgi:hypothetical protein
MELGPMIYLIGTLVSAISLLTIPSCLLPNLESSAGRSHVNISGRSEIQCS